MLCEIGLEHQPCGALWRDGNRVLHKRLRPREPGRAEAPVQPVSNSGGLPFEAHRSHFLPKFGEVPVTFAVALLQVDSVCVDDARVDTMLAFGEDAVSEPPLGRTKW